MSVVYEITVTQFIRNEVSDLAIEKYDNIKRKHTC